jgi:REP element-mobilizing transposase RayT
VVFSTKNRSPDVQESWRDRLHGYLGGILRGIEVVPEEIGGTSDHVHLLIGLRAIHCLAEVLRVLKATSSSWVHREIGHRMFAWQDGYGAFTVGSSDVERVRSYIRNQAEHHRCRTFQEEYLELLRENFVEFDERFLW